MKPRVLLWDCETMPNIAAVWGKWEQNVLWYECEGYVFCFAYKWLGEAKTRIISLPDFKSYKKHPRDDKPLVEALHALFEEADVIIAHNGDSFDQKVASGRFLIHGLIPPAPYKQVDTLKVARKHFRLNSNKLDDLARVLGVGRKERTGGIDLWQDVYHHDPKAIRKMTSYNIQDTKLLERVYLKLRPWINNHPSMSNLSHRPEACPKCGGGKMYAGMKYATSAVNLYQYFRCADCGGMSKSRVPLKQEKPMYI